MRANAARVLSHLIRVGSLSWKRGRLLTSRTERTPDSRLDLLSRQLNSQPAALHAPNLGLSDPGFAGGFELKIAQWTPCRLGIELWYI